MNQIAERFPDTTRVYGFDDAVPPARVSLSQDPAAPRAFHLGGALQGTIDARRWADAHRGLMARALEAGLGPGRLVSLSRREAVSMTESYKTDEWKEQVRAMRKEGEA